MRLTRPGPALIAAACALAVALTGCGDQTATSAGTVAAAGADVSSPAASQLRVASGLTVAEVLADATGEPLAAQAFLFVSPDGSARLCDASAESFPPQCGGPSIAVTGLPPELVDGLSEDSGRRWSDGPVQLIGTVVGGVFVNDPVALAAS